MRQRATATRPFIAPSRRRACPSPCFLRSVATVGSSAATTWLCRASLHAPIDTRTASRRSRVVRNTWKQFEVPLHATDRGLKRGKKYCSPGYFCFQSTSVHCVDDSTNSSAFTHCRNFRGKLRTFDRGFSASTRRVWKSIFTCAILSSNPTRRI